MDVSQQQQAEGEYVIRGHNKLVGEFGPLYIRRVFDANGDPIGYERLTGAALLRNPDQEAKFNLLPRVFTYTKARAIYGKGPQATLDWLQKAIGAGILERLPDKTYQRTDPLTV